VTGPKNALAAWGRSALRPVVLPSGMKALVKLPDPGELIRNDALPQDLRAMAAKYASTGVEISDLKGPEIMTFLNLTYELIARAVKYLATSDSAAWDAFLRDGGDPSAEGWEPVTLAAAFFAGEADVDQADVEALAQIVGRSVTPNEVTNRSRQDLGLNADPLDPEDGGRVSDFAGFRGKPGGAERGADGEDVRSPAIVAPAGERPGRRIRSR
jgi:hypothetical protein